MLHGSLRVSKYVPTVVPLGLAVRYERVIGTSGSTRLRAQISEGRSRSSMILLIKFICVSDAFRIVAWLLTLSFAMTKSQEIASNLNLPIFWQTDITINDWNRHLDRHHDDDCR